MEQGNPRLQSREELRPLNHALQFVYHADMSDIRVNRNCVYQTAYHVIWCPQYRKSILTGRIADRVASILTDICDERAWPIVTEKRPPQAPGFSHGEKAVGFAVFVEEEHMMAGESIQQGGGTCGGRCGERNDPFGCL
jgi:hypothetical protein